MGSLFKNFSIRQKVFIRFGFVLVGVAVLIFVNALNSKNAIKLAEKTEKESMYLAILAKDMQIHVIQVQ